MARLSGIKTKLLKYNIDEKVTKEIIGNGDLVGVIERMEKLLSPEIIYEILDSSACATSKKELNGIKKIEAETLQKKIANIALLGDFHADWNVVLNEDNTLTAGWVIKENDGFACVCTSTVNKKLKVRDITHENRTMPLTYCLCCAGHCRQHLEKLLDIQLKTKEIVSSPINSKGQKPCEFIFHIIK
ncbi:hypothetical protein SAMN02745248_00258 [Hathewaya proteolytica DSM 3090]|uniref:L-2-amino-thiazoline-4-carboxylic acid hydrolase n=1 Tax=Hathewaya proteolytica DSM 3090 TaxID=1121331 RepID=A0A1M6JNP6_9CLOT|nr:hypothetical protein [Hathewaya proteolytica]SHJ48286.1 hypothetical protein SAMN02745248_00258 [Hathewaya proteolytica DSM 3090]